MTTNSDEEIIEKDPLDEIFIKKHIIKLEEQLEILRKDLIKFQEMGISRYVMKIYIQKRTKLSMKKINAFLKSQDNFFIEMGVRK